MRIIGARRFSKVELMKITSGEPVGRYLRKLKIKNLKFKISLQDDADRYCLKPARQTQLVKMEELD
jgi:hypothetical protein